MAPWTAPWRAPLLVAGSDEPIQDSYNVGKNWPPAHGAIGEVVLKSTGESRTVHTLSKLKDAERIRREVTIMKSLESPNTLQLLEVFEDSKWVHLIVEHCAGGTALKCLTKARRFAEAQARNLMQQLLRAVRYMHERCLCHRNLQMRSILFTTPGPVTTETVLKVGDFSLACKFEANKPLTDARGPVGYIAPEVIDKEYSSPCDLWSCGVIMYYMLCGYLPFSGKSDQEVMRESHRGSFFFYPTHWKQVSDSAKDLIRCLLKRRAAQRCSAVQALHHEWFTGPRRRIDAAALRALGGEAKATDEQAVTEATHSDADGLDLELDSDPSVEWDVDGPLRINASLRPTLLLAECGQPGDGGQAAGGRPGR